MSLNSINMVARAKPATHQRYFLDIPQAASSTHADVFAFEGERAIGAATRYVVSFTHPQRDLSRAEYLNKPATFVIQPPFDRYRMREPEPPRRVQGVITGFAQLAHNRDQTTYEIVLESRLALLRNAPKCRFFLNKSFPEIIGQILHEHEFDQIHGRFEFKLYRAYEKRAFVMQWEEDDLSFITRLCRRSGIWFVCEESKHCESVRFGDDFTHYRRDPSLSVPYREPSGLVTNGAESVDALQMHATTLPTNYTVRTFNTESPASKPISGDSPVRGDSTTYGETYTWGTPNLTAAEAREEAQLRREASLAAQVTYHGTCDVLDLTPVSVLKLSNRALPDAPHGLLAVSVKCSASRSKSYRVEFTAIPSDRLYRLPLFEHTWPKIDSVITGTIASPGKYKAPYLDQQGCYIVHIHADKDTRTPGLESCPMRLAKPFAGAGQTGFHFGLVEGTIVTVGFLWGNPDLPFISQVLHTAQATDPIISGYPWGTRNTLRTRSNNTLEMDDREGREHLKLATEHGKTQLNLGYTVDRHNKDRGQGFELRSDNRGNVRAGGGLHLTAYAQPKAQGVQIDMTGAMNQFELSNAHAQGVAQMAAVAKAEVADLKTENQWLKDELSDLKKAVIALSAPHGIGLSTPDRVVIAAGKDIGVSSSANVSFSALKKIIVAAGEVLSLFAQAGIKLIAGRGKVEIQAQAGAMELVSQQNMQLTSAGGTLTANAVNGVVLSGGGSAYIKVVGDNVEIGGAGCLILKVIEMQKDGPGSLTLPLPKFSQANIVNNEKFVLCDDITGRPLANRPYRIELANGEMVEGRTSQDGETSLSTSDVAQGMKLQLSKTRVA